MAQTNWAVIDGDASQDPLELPLDRFLNLIYAWAVRDADASEVAKFDARLWMPPVGVVAESGPWSVEAETQAFGAFAAQVNPGNVT